MNIRNSLQDSLKEKNLCFKKVTDEVWYSPVDIQDVLISEIWNNISQSIILTHSEIRFNLMDLYEYDLKK